MIYHSSDPRYRDSDFFSSALLLGVVESHLRFRFIISFHCETYFHRYSFLTPNHLVLNLRFHDLIVPIGLKSTGNVTTSTNMIGAESYHYCLGEAANNIVWFEVILS
jgi:hypothetical protein